MLTYLLLAWWLSGFASCIYTTVSQDRHLRPLDIIFAAIAGLFGLLTLFFLLAPYLKWLERPLWKAKRFH